jgi:hypothetical protein
LLVGGLLLTPATVRAQNIGHGDPTPAWEFPLPLMLDTKEDGFYLAAEAIYWKLNNPLHKQVLAVRGIFDESGLISGRGPLVTITDANGNFLTRLFRDPGRAGQFLGSGEIALVADDVGTENYQPGWRLTFGYRFQNDLAVEGVYWKMMDAEHIASAGILPPSINVGNDFATSFLSAPFFNYPTDFAGAERDVVSNVIPPPAPPAGQQPPLNAVQTADVTLFRGIVVPAFGITNAAEMMSLEFKQEMWSAELNFRLPVTQTENTRCYAIVGPRYVFVREVFDWRIVDADIVGDLLAENVVNYTNAAESKLYGVQAGLGSEAYIHQGFALSLEGRAGIFANAFNGHVKYLRGDEAVVVQRVHNDTELCPMVQAGGYLWWYPVEGIQIRMGYEFLGFFNMPRSSDPVDFNVGSLSPEFEEEFLFIHGASLGIAFIF